MGDPIAELEKTLRDENDKRTEEGPDDGPASGDAKS
jgi:hypothetical protein